MSDSDRKMVNAWQPANQRTVPNAQLWPAKFEAQGVLQAQEKKPSAGLGGLGEPTAGLTESPPDGR